MFSHGLQPQNLAAFRGVNRKSHRRWDRKLQAATGRAEIVAAPVVGAAVLRGLGRRVIRHAATTGRGVTRDIGRAAGDPQPRRPAMRPVSVDGPD